MHQRARDSGGKFIYFTVCLTPAFPNFPHFDIWFLVSVRDWTQFCYARGFENILTRPSTRYLIRCGCIFLLSLKQIPKMIRIHLMRVDGEAVSGKKMLRFQNYPDTVDGVLALHGYC